MLSLDLFNTKYERELAEGAVDNLEARRIDDLNMKMLDLLDRAKSANPEMKEALKREFQKIKSERDSYFKINPATGMNDSGTLGITKGALDEVGIGQDIVNKTEKMARATPQTKTGAVASTVKNAAKWLAGKGGPGQEGPTYESAQKKNSEEIEEAGGGWALDPKTRLELKKRKQRNKTIAKWAGRPVPTQEPVEKEIKEDQRLHVGDPIIVTAPNEFEGKTGEVAEFSPSGKFVVVNLYNHGEHSMHLSDVEYNQYAADQDQDDWYDDEEVAEGWSDAVVARRTGKPRTPYSVYIKGRKWKDFENDDHAEAVANKLRAKFQADGRDPSVITIAPTDYDKGMTEAEDRVDPILLKALKRMPDGLATHHEVLDAAYDAYAMELGYLSMKGNHGVTDVYIPKLMGLYKNKHGLTFNEEYTPSPAKPFRNPKGFNKQGTGIGNKLADLNRAELANIQPSKGTPVPAKEFARGVLKDLKKVNVKEQGVAEAETDYSKRRAREKDVDAGKPVAKQRQSKMTDYQKKRAQDKKEMELGEQLKEDVDTSPIVQAILKRIMVAHKDLLAKYGPEKIMNAAEDVAYNVGDYQDIGSSDVSQFVHQIKQILGAE